MSRTYPALLLCAATLTFTACGDDSDEGDSTTAGTDAGADLTAVKDYLTEHSAELAAQTEELKTLGQEYYDLAEAADFDYGALMKESGDDVQRIMEDSKAAFEVANPAYEEMEGVVAGVPRLAQYDVDIDAGADSSDPENAVSYSLDLPNGETLKQPGNAFFVTETSLFGTNPDFLADTRAGRRRRRQGGVRRGNPGREHLPGDGREVRRAGRRPRRRRSGVRAH